MKGERGGGVAGGRGVAEGGPSRPPSNMAKKPSKDEEWDSDNSLSWEDFFGNSSATDLVPTLLGMYDALIGRGEPEHSSAKNQGKLRQPPKKSTSNPDPPPPPAEPPPEVQKKPPVEANEGSGGGAPPSMEDSAAVRTPAPEAVGIYPAAPRLSCQRKKEGGGSSEERPLSVTSIASSSSASSSSSGSSSGGRNRGRSKSCAYLASVESLGDDELSLGDEEEVTPEEGPRRKGTRSVSVGDHRGGESGTGSVDGGVSNGFARGAIVSRNPRGHHSYPQHHRQHLLGRRLFIPPPSSASTAASSTSGVSSATSSSSSSSSSSSFPAATCSHISPPSLPTGPKPRYCDPHLSYMDRVVMEIAETEAIYVRDLQQVIEGYLHRWRSSPDCPIGSKQLKDLFGNIEDIYLFNSEFLCELEQCGLDPVKVAKTFVKNNSGFSIYTDYCTNYPRTVSVLTELMRQDTTVRLFRERQTALQHTLPLGSYLLKPVQRILKYHLLLQNIVKHFGKDSEGYRDIADALSAMTGIAHHINEMKRRHEHAIRVQEIQSLLYGWEGEDLTTFGELCAEGAFRMHGAKALRHAFLFDRMLLLTKRKEEGMLTYKAHILCSNLMLIESVPGEPLSFHVIPFDNPRLQYTLQARNLEQKREWTLQLKRVILENYNAVIPTHARQLVMELGQNRTDDEIMAEKSAPKRQHSAPEYLERRKQERRKSETGLLLRTRLRRSHRKEGSVVPGDGMSSKESPAVYRRGRRAQSVSQDRSDSCNRGRGGGDHRAETLPSTAEKVKDRFGSWRRKSEPSYSSKSNSSIGHLSIYVSPDFIERSTDSLVDETRKVENSMQEDNSCSEVNAEGDSQDDQSVKMEVEDAKIGQNELSKAEIRKEIQSTNGENEVECREESLEEIVGQLVMQSRQFQRMLMRQHRKAQGGGTSRSRHHSREHQRSDDNSVQNTCSPQQNGDISDQQPSPHTSIQEAEESSKQPSTSNTFRAQRQAHMRALRQEQRMSTIVHQKNTHEEESKNHSSTDYVTLTFNEGVLKSADGIPVEGVSNGCMSNDELNKPSNLNESYFGNYDNLQNVWESVRQAEKQLKEVVTSTDVSPFINDKEEHSPWSSPGLEPCIPTLPAVWLKQQEGHLATPSLKSGSLPRGFQLGRPQRQLPHRQSQRCTPFEVSPSSTLPHLDGNNHNDEGYPSSLFRMERPFTIASESPGRADEIDFEDIEQYMAETGRSGTGMSFLPPRFPLPPLQDVDGQEGDHEEDDEEDEEVAEENSSTAHIHVHPEYRIYRPSVSRAALRHVISSVSSKLANLRVGASSGGITTEDEEDGEEGEEGDDLVGEVRVTNHRGRNRRRIGNSCPNSLDSNHMYGGRGGHVSGGDSESEAGKGGSRLVYTLARHYSRSLKERIRSIMTMNVVGSSNAEDDQDCFKGGDSESQVSDHFISQDNLNQTNSRTSPVKSTTPPVTYHKQGSSSLGARIAHGGDAPDYATPHIRGVTDRTTVKEPLSSRPDSLLSATSSAFTSSSDGDKVSCYAQETRTSHLGTQMEENNCSRKVCAEEDEEDDDDDCRGSGDSYYERSFEAIESFLGDPSMGCTIVGDTFRDSAIFSDHDEVELIMARVNETSKTAPPFLQPPKVTSTRAKIPPPVPAKPTASSIAIAAGSTQPPQCVAFLANSDQSIKESQPPLPVGVSVQEKLPSIKGNLQHRHEIHSSIQTQLLGVKSVRERRRELEMWRSSLDISGCCAFGEGGVSEGIKRVGHKIEGCLENGRLTVGIGSDGIVENSGVVRDNESEEGGATPKGWVRHVIGKLQGD